MKPNWQKLASLVQEIVFCFCDNTLTFIGNPFIKYLFCMFKCARI